MNHGKWSEDEEDCIEAILYYRHMIQNTINKLNRSNKAINERISILEQKRYGIIYNKDG